MNAVWRKRTSAKSMLAKELEKYEAQPTKFEPRNKITARRYIYFVVFIIMVKGSSFYADAYAIFIW